MTPSTPSSVSELMSEVKARLAKPDIAVIERWDKVTGAHDVYSPDLERMSTDLRRLLDICAVYETALSTLLDRAVFMDVTEGLKLLQGALRAGEKLASEGSDTTDAEHEAALAGAYRGEDWGSND